MKRYVLILILMVAFAGIGLTVEASPPVKVLVKEKITTQLPSGFGLYTFVKYISDCDCYGAEEITTQMMKNLGFKYLKKGTTLMLTSAYSETTKIITSNVYCYGGIMVTVNEYGKGESIVFPNRETMDEFLETVSFFQVEQNGFYYSLPGLAAFYCDGLTLYFDFTP